MCETVVLQGSGAPLSESLKRFKFIDAVAEEFALSEEDKRYLIRIARDAIGSKLRGDPPSRLSPPSETVNEPAGAFVTLRVRDATADRPSLRGCIGHVVATRPLAETVRDSAVSAAFRDPRFPPLTLPELEHVIIEISVLSPLKTVASSDEVVPGKHGVMLSGFGRSGLLLPQVATEQGWDRDTFLTHCCYKAGLAGDCWQNPATEIQVFTATVFEETELEERE
jgi:AmmeMemoRadiSam system protein A